MVNKFEDITKLLSKANTYSEDVNYFIKNKENKFEEDIRSLLSEIGTRTIHLPETSKKNIILPDTMCLSSSEDFLCREDVYFIEFKRKNKYKLSDIQRVTYNHFFKNIRANNYICRTWEDFIHMMEQLYL